MKQKFIRLAAPALALILALTLSVSLAAPGYAGSAGGTGSPDTPPETSTSPDPGTSTSPDPGTSTSPDPGTSASPDPGTSASPDPGTSASPDPEPTDSGGAGGAAPVSINFTRTGTVLWTSTTTDAEKTLSVKLSGSSEANPTIKWSAQPVPGKAQPGVVAPTLSGTGLEVTVNQQTAGEFEITAEYTYGGKPYEATIRLIISGIVLSGTSGTELETVTKERTEKTLKMVVNGSAALIADLYGDAEDAGGALEWTSDDTSVVSVMPNAGSLNAWRIGTTAITARKGDYSAFCTVEVEEDKSALVETENDGKTPLTASFSKPLTFDTFYEMLEKICEAKTEAAGSRHSLDYINNLSVSTGQGTLYYNYNTEADTGSGVGANDQFAGKAGGSVRGVDKLYFVPKQGFSGKADITFRAVAGTRSFTGVIRVEVGAGSEAYQISYRAQAGEPVWFSTSDFDAFCQSGNDRGLDYVIFNLPRSSDGVLYYNYTTAGSGNPVASDTRFSRSGRYTLDDVCFVPNAALENDSEVRINFRAVDTSGGAIDGWVTVNVTASGSEGEKSAVPISGERGRPVTLLSSLFYDACQRTLGDTLSFVTFRLPDPEVGTLYVNYRGEGSYDSRVTAATRCYYSGVPGLDTISFVPASAATGQVAIPYTGYGAGGASYSGTLYIILEDVDRATIYYSVPKDGSVTFRAADFSSAALYATGSGVNYIRFTGIKFKGMSGAAGSGSLYYNYTSGSSVKISVPSTTRYYISPTSSTYRGLSRVSFRAGDEVGTVTITYDAYRSVSDSKPSFTGTVVIQVGSVTPGDVNLSCRTSGEAQLTVSAVNAVCGAAMNGSLSYIEITSLPAAEMGRLYFNYSGFGTGEAVEPGDRFYCLGWPGIGQLKFIPRAGFSGVAEITYIGYSYNGQEKVSGRIVVNVTSSAASRYFNDMDRYTWAMDSVDYLYRNNTVAGRGDGRFDPSGSITRGDFTLMLVKAYGLTATGSASFNDVPAGKYYADAIRVAAVLGIAGGDADGNFNPTAPITRQDAMVMVYNTLRYSGKAASNGLAADFSAYRDAEEIAGYAREAMGSLIQMGVVTGNGNGYLLPLDRINRAEAAVLLHKIMTM